MDWKQENVTSKLKPKNTVEVLKGFESKGTKSDLEVHIIVCTSTHIMLYDSHTHPEFLDQLVPAMHLSFLTEVIGPAIAIGL